MSDGRGPVSPLCSQDWMGFWKEYSSLALIGGAGPEVISPPKKQEVGLVPRTVALSKLQQGSVNLRGFESP